MLPGSILAYAELSMNYMRHIPGVKIRADNSFILGSGRGKEKIMQCYDIKLQRLLTKKRKNTRLSGEKLVSFPTLDGPFLCPSKP